LTLQTYFFIEKNWLTL